MRNMPSHIGMLVAGLLAAPALMTVGACASINRERETSLAAAGFMDRPANTAERQAMLARLPAHKFVRRVRGDSVHYVYADPTGCNCLYVGDQQAYGRYQRQQQRQHIADQNALTAMQYSDAAWNWGAWGPFGSRWGWGPGFGW